MPNRILKDSICTSDNIDGLSVEAERFFYRLMVQADDFGRMDARLPVLRARCYPLKLDTVSEADIANWLLELEKLDLIRQYQSGGKPYLYFVTWEKHQQIRAKRSKYPEPVVNDSNQNGLISSDINGNQLKSNVPENPIQSNTNTTPQAGDGSSVDIEFGELAREYEKNIGTLSEMISRQLADDLDEYGLELCKKAMIEAVGQNVRKWKYVRGILGNWKRDGINPSPGKTKSESDPPLAYFDVGNERRWYKGETLVKTEQIGDEQ